MDEPTEPPGSPSAPLSTLRGAGVEVDARHLGVLILGVCLVSVAIVSAILFVAGFQKNDQITRLRQQGVPVEVTVTGCLGMMGGSGSNLAGYQCRGSLRMGGHRYTESIPGNTLYVPGTTLRAVVVPGDPALLTTPRLLAGEHASAKVFVLPVILVAALALIGGFLELRRRRVRARRVAGYRLGAV